MWSFFRRWASANHSSVPAVEPLEQRALFSANGVVVEPITDAPDDGGTPLPAVRVVAQLQKALANRPAGAALGKVLALPAFTGFYHS